MEELSKYSQIELLKLSNDIKARHDALKQEIIVDSYELEELVKKINEKALILDGLEKNYIEIIEKIIE